MVSCMKEIGSLIHSKSRRLDVCDRDSLEADVSMEEIKMAVWGCGSEKPPSPMATPSAFCQKHPSADVAVPTEVTGKGSKRKRPILGRQGKRQAEYPYQTRNLCAKATSRKLKAPSRSVLMTVPDVNYPCLGKGPEEGGRRAIISNIGVVSSSYMSFSLSCRTWNPPAGQRSTKASTCTCKKPTIPTRLLSRPSIGRQTPPPGVTMWKRSGWHVPSRNSAELE
ncbi:hypothetical protein Tco_1220908 [Tanacetum coccineum]